MSYLASLGPSAVAAPFSRIRIDRGDDPDVGASSRVDDQEHSPRFRRSEDRPTPLRSRAARRAADRGRIQEGLLGLGWLDARLKKVLRVGVIPLEYAILR